MDLCSHSWGKLNYQILILFTISLLPTSFPNILTFLALPSLITQSPYSLVEVFYFNK